MGTFDAGLIRDNIRTETGYWFALPSFIGGMARVIDLFGVCNRYRYADSEGEADSNAIRRDFEAVGRDIRAAMATKWAGAENLSKESQRPCSIPARYRFQPISQDTNRSFPEQPSE